MTLPLDDAQVLRHTFAQVADQCAILVEELRKVNIHGELQDKLVAEYFKAFMTATFAPNPAEILKEFFPKEGG